MGIKTPLDLVRHMAEFEVNLFGAEASISGDDNEAVLFNEKPAPWLEAKKIAKMNQEQEKEMQKHHEQWLKHLAEKLVFNIKFETAADVNSETLTFSRK
jgi:predicted RNA-binding protein Jag